MLFCLAISALWSPLGSLPTAHARYQESAFSLGMVEGYMTMDALGAVGFGWVVTQALRGFGIRTKQRTLYHIKRVVLVYALLMICCYGAMSYLGSTASHLGGNVTHGGQILTAYAAGEFGLFGQGIFSVIAILACFHCCWAD